MKNQLLSFLLFLAFQPISVQSQKLNPENFSNLTWRNIGPFRGGRSNAVAGIPGNDQVYFVGYTGGGVWKTSNAGLTWKNISDGFFKTSSVGDIAISTSDPNVIYVGMGEHAIRGVMTSYGDGVYKSLNGGETWENVGLKNSRHISDVIIHPSNPDVVWVAVQGPAHGTSKERGIYKSLDGGKSWKQVLFVDENTGASSLSLDTNNPRILYAATWDHIRFPWKVQSGGKGSGLWKSIDGGETWVKLTQGLPTEMGKSGISVSPADPQRVYAIIETEKSKSGLYRSDDAGKSWKLLSNNQDISSRSWYYMEVYADPKNPDKVYVLNSPLMVSIDGGKTFNRLPVKHIDTHDLWINPNNTNNLILGDDGGAEISFNGGKNWTTQDNQATSQFYRVNADLTFPYKVYGGQQDNSSVVIASRTNGIGITDKDWFPGPGCECAFVTFNPTNPVILYGGCYQGILEALDTRTNEGKDIRAYPSLNLAQYPKTLKYRFNWNSPLLVSKYNPEVLFHGAQKLLKSEDGGINWQEISPDLTRNDSTKQMEGGGPFTNEGAGGENYNTLTYIAESPIENEVLATGSDCGLVYLTRDGGKSWENITPSGLPESNIQSIEWSSHQKGTLYIAATRYKFNDLSPLSYKSTDYGKSWTKISKGIQSDDFLKVIREDDKVQGLLYGGAEHGFYISHNGGSEWQKLQLNLPVVPITDMIIRDHDLVVSTAGRAFWIFDDLSVLKDAVKQNLQDQPLLFSSKPTVRFTSSAPSWMEPPFGIGQNPPNGFAIHYYVPEENGEKLYTLDIEDENGKVVRSFSSKNENKLKPYPGGPPAPKVLTTHTGINRFYWDFRKEPLSGVQGVYVYGNYAGIMVPPGKYKAKLTAGDIIMETELNLLPDPRIQIPQENWTDQQQVGDQISAAILEIHESVENLTKIKSQIEFLENNLADNAHQSELKELCKNLLDKINAWEASIIERRTANGQDVINWPSGLNVEFFNLKSAVDGHDPIVTQGVKERFRDLQNTWKNAKENLEKILTEDIPDFNQKFTSKGFQPLQFKN